MNDFERGLHYFHSENYKKAFELLRSGEKFNNLDVLLALGDMYGNGLGVSKNTGEAIKVLEKAREIAPKDARAATNLSHYYLWENYRAKAKEAADQACQINPSDTAYTDYRDQFFVDKYGNSVWSHAREEYHEGENPEASQRYADFYREYAFKANPDEVRKIESELLEYHQIKRDLLKTPHQKYEESRRGDGDYSAFHKPVEAGSATHVLVWGMIIVVILIVIF